jgi:cytochrome d ubiquinol oxidase subunit I
LHWLSGVVVAVSGIFSGIFVVTANAWMNAPAGFKAVDGKITDIDPIAAMLNPASFHEVLHMTLAAFVATGFAAAAVHAFFLLRDRHSLLHRSALGIALAVASVSIPLQIASGDFSARAVGRLQPAKLAAMEALYRTQTGARSRAKWFTNGAWAKNFIMRRRGRTLKKKSIASSRPRTKKRTRSSSCKSRTRKS